MACAFISQSVESWNSSRNSRRRSVLHKHPALLQVGSRSQIAAHGIFLSRNAAENGSVDGRRSTRRREVELRSRQPQAPAKVVALAAKDRLCARCNNIR